MSIAREQRGRRTTRHSTPVSACDAACDAPGVRSIAGRRAPGRCSVVEDDGPGPAAIGSPRRMPCRATAPCGSCPRSCECAAGHHEVHLGLELQHEDQVQPRIVAIVVRPVAKAHAPDHVVGVPARLLWLSTNGDCSCSRSIWENQAPSTSSCAPWTSATNQRISSSTMKAGAKICL